MVLEFSEICRLSLQYKSRLSVSQLLFPISLVLDFLYSSPLLPFPPSSTFPMPFLSFLFCFSFHDIVHFSFPFLFIVPSFSFTFILFPFPLHFFPCLQIPSFIRFLSFQFYIAVFNSTIFLFRSFLTSLFLSVLLCLLFLPLLWLPFFYFPSSQLPCLLLINLISVILI